MWKNRILSCEDISYRAIMRKHENKQMKDRIGRKNNDKQHQIRGKT